MAYGSDTKPFNSDPKEMDIFCCAQRHVSMCAHAMANPPSCFSARDQRASHAQIRRENFSVQEFLCVGLPTESVSNPIV